MRSSQKSKVKSQNPEGARLLCRPLGRCFLARTQVPGTSTEKWFRHPTRSKVKTPKGRVSCAGSGSGTRRGQKSKVKIIPFRFIPSKVEFPKRPIGEGFKIQNPKSKIQNGISSLFLNFVFCILCGVAGLGVSVVVFASMPPALAQAVSAAVQQAFALLKQGRVMDAIAAFQKALRREPQSLEAKLGLAIAYRRQGLITEAWQAYQNVLAQDPTNQLALKTLGLLSTYRSEWQVQGIEALTTLLKINPNDTEALANRALLYGYQQRFSEALADYQIVLQGNPTPDVLLGAAETYTNSGNPQQGLELFNRYQQVSGKPIAGYQALAYARALRETGNPAQAVQVLEAALQTSSKLDDLGIQTRAALSQAYLANRQFNEARAVLAPLQGRPDAVLPLARSLNEIRNQTNDPTLASEVATLYRQALNSTPNPDPKLVREVADVFSSLPQEQQTALQLYRQLAASQPNDRGLIVKQLALESQLGLIAKADLRSRLYAALQPLPTDPVELRTIAQALAGIEAPGPEFLPIYQNLLAAGVNVPFLNFRMAQLAIEQNNLVGARGALAAYATTSEGARDLAPQLLAAEIERREGNLEASAQRYQGLIASNPADQDVLNAALRGLAGIRLQQNRPAEALFIFDQLIARNPQDLTLQLARTSLAYQAKLITESQAEAVLNYWLASQRSTNAPPELFTLVGTLPADLKREPLYNALVQIDPNNIPVQLRLLQVIAKRNPAEAKARVTQLVARNPNTIGAYLLQGELARGIGELDLASKAYETILSAQPNNLEALSALGGIRFQQRRFDSATQLYSQALALKPDDLGIRRSLISLEAVQDRQLAALQALEQLQLEQIQKGAPSSDVSRQMQQIQEGFLQRRGFQPPWERY
jgi:tetratricopeptide (TPR) repeat protein